MPNNILFKKTCWWRNERTKVDGALKVFRKSRAKKTIDMPTMVSIQLELE